MAIADPHPLTEGDAPHRHEEGASHSLEGPYIIAPDSAKPWPDEIWMRIDLDDLETAVVDLDAPAVGVGAAEVERYKTPSGIFIPTSDRELLRRIGGPAASKALRRLNKS